MTLVLASGSPRRRMLLEACGVPLAAVRPPRIPEAPAPGEDAVAYVRRLAAEKAQAVAAPGHWILAADTTVHLEGHLFEKPDDEAHAVEMLVALSGRAHSVSTGWCLRWGGPGQPTPVPSASASTLSVVTSTVWFRPFTRREAAAYVALGESLDKAGAYGIQGAGAALVDRVEGSHTGVVGLPLEAVVPALRAAGLLSQETP